MPEIIQIRRDPGSARGIVFSWRGSMTRGLGTRGIIIASSLLLGCATYHPRPGRHIARESAGFVRDGQRFAIGSLGGGSDALVNHHPPALEHVHRQERLLRWGWAVIGLGLVTMVAGSMAADRIAPAEARPAAPLGAVGLGAAISVVGFVLELKGQAALIDAINVYNDDIDARPLEAPR
jgi:hypothetical protein